MEIYLEIISAVILPFLMIQEGQLSATDEKVCEQVLVKCLED